MSQQCAWNGSTYYLATLSNEPAECMKQIHILPPCTKQWASGVYYTDPQITSLHCSIKRLSACNRSTRYLATQNNEAAEFMQKTQNVPRHTKQRNDWVQNQAVCWKKPHNARIHTFTHRDTCIKDSNQYKCSTIKGYLNVNVLRLVTDLRGSVGGILLLFWSIRVQILVRGPRALTEVLCCFPCPRGKCRDRASN